MMLRAAGLLLVVGLAACGKKQDAPPSAAPPTDAGPAVVDERVKRLADLRARLSAPGGASNSLGTYAQYQDALAAAGLARSLGEKEAYVRQLLLSASNSAMGVVPMPEGEDDDSAANAQTLINALYASLASQHMEGIHRFAKLRPSAYDSKKAPSSALAKATAVALQVAARGNREETTKLCRDALELPNAPDKDFYGPQLEALRAWAAHEPLPLDAVKTANRAAEERQGHAEMVYLELPVLGLRALELLKGDPATPPRKR
jgi:hypothetical protein